MKHFGISLWICLMLFCLCACGASDTDTPVPDETVPNVFTEPHVENQPDDPTITETSPTDPTEKESQLIGNLAHGFYHPQWEEDDHGLYQEYNGGEMVITYSIDATGIAAADGVGILLFVDGQLQPYKCTEDDTYRYMHTFYPTDGVPFKTEFRFTPVTGQQGDMLEIYGLNIRYPDYRRSDGDAGLLFTRGSVGAGVRIKFNATPEKVDYQLSSDRVISQSISYVDVTSAEIRGWSDEDLLKECETVFTINGEGKSNMVLTGITAAAPLDLHFEVWGSPYVEYGLIFFVDNRPISDEPMLFNMETGKKVVVDVQIDFSDFQSESYIYAVLVPRNYRSTPVKTYCFIQWTGTYELLGAE